MNIKSYAKINLTLDIIRRLEDGYHEINSLMQQIELADDISLENIKEDKIIIECEEVPGERNLAYKAASLLKKNHKIKKGVKIKIKKNIPLSSGLSGGSSNAAYTLRALDKLWSLNLNKEQFLSLSAEIGMDVPFHIIEGSALVKGRGDLLQKLPPLPEMSVLLVNNGIDISTKEAYESVNLEKCGKIRATNKILEIINEKDIRKIAQYLNNDFEYSIFDSYPILNKIKKELIANNALNAVMSGSGSTIFGVFEDEDKAKKAYEELKNKYKFVKLTKTRK